ncbi:hypothetical protein [Mitsuokella multacida]|uniref:hypothetical protein n=1 Tax=Mitsuokella multacida TaxID=52226 RepID=UPI0001B46B61|nr:hypothetical protein [Mitsuokella multacida]
MIEVGDTVVTRLIEGKHCRSKSFVRLYNDMTGRVIGRTFMPHLGYFTYLVETSWTDDALFFTEDELKVVK